MTVTLEDRPIETVRSEVIDQLIMNYSHGELSFEAFERRLDQAMNTTDHKDLTNLIKDLPLTVDETYLKTKQQESNFSYAHGQAEEQEHMVNVFSGNDYKGQWKVPKKLNIFSLFSGVDLDFSEAQFYQSVVHIKSFSLFSGLDIYIPENVNVITKTFSIFAGVSNKSIHNANKQAPTIIIEGVSIFSGITIKPKLSLKERFVSFADSVKQMFN